MNTSEFKAWFNGFVEAIGRDELPTPKQWQRVQEEVERLTAETKYVPQPAPSFPPKVYGPGVRGPDPFWNQPIGNHKYSLTAQATPALNPGELLDKEEVLNRR